jgi:PAS domain S-box-containing protein
MAPKRNDDRTQRLPSPSGEIQLSSQTLSDCEARNHALIHAIPDVIFINRRDGEYLSIHAPNPGLLPIPPKALLHRKIQEVLPGPVAAQCLKAIADALDSGALQEMTYSLPVNGQERHFEARVAPCTADTALTIVRDITKRKQTEVALLLFKALVDHSSDAIGLSTPDGKHYYQNEAFNRLFGDGGSYPSETLYADPAVGKEVFQTIMGGGNWQGEVKMYHTDKTLLDIFLRAYAIRDPQGRILGLVCLHTDITGRKQAEEEKTQLESELHQSQKMESIGRLAGGVAHDFNNILQAILGNVELALGQTKPDDTIHQDLLEVQSASLRAADLTHQLLAFARKQTIAPRLIDLNQTVEGMLSMLRRLVGDDVRLVWTPAAELWPVRMDPAQTDQILANLCVNSRDAMGGNGEIQIETKNVHVDELHASRHEGFSPGDYVLLMVSDTGCGMGKETQERIFEPFFTTKDMGRGTGLGLSTVYGIVRQNHGHIAVYSEPGKGTTFRLYLPRSRNARMEAPAEAPAKPLTRGNETLLLVEDELAILKLTTKILEQQGYTVLAANDPADAIQLVRDHAGPIHLLLTDIVMPRMNGRELSERLKAIHPKIKCLFMSGYPANVIARQGILEEGVHFIQKPFSMADLDAKIRKALEPTET